MRTVIALPVVFDRVGCRGAGQDKAYESGKYLSWEVLNYFVEERSGNESAASAETIW